MTADDEEIARIIKTTASDTLERLDGLDFESMSIGEIGQAFKDLRDYAESQRARIGFFTPSECTSDAADTFNESMDLLESSSQDFLDWLATGSSGEPPVDDATRAGELLAQANGQLAAAC